jgi:hypothetical protein
MFIGTPGTITMGGTVTTASVAIRPAAGIEEIAGFTYRSDLSGTLEAFDTTIGTLHAVAITGSNDPTHGIVLTGMPAVDTAVNLMSSHLTIGGGTAIIA